MPSFISELKRRNVLRVAAAYGLVAWIIIEAGSVLMPTFGAPEWVFQMYVIVVLCGFVLSLVFAWIYEITPDGVKLDRDVDRSVEVSPEQQQRKNFAIIALLVVALTVSITFNVTGIRESDSESTDVSERRSVAVLPFESRSPDADNALFADGIHDDLLTKLANNRSLVVISRTSVMEYRDTTKNIREIGRELGVDTILQGAVQRIGDNVRINVQLVDARSDENLWAKSYDRSMTMADVFGIQSDISASIAVELRAALSPEDQSRMDRIPTENLVAFNRYNEGRSDMAKRELNSALSARRKFEEAVALDPAFAEAHAALATSILLLYINNQAIEMNEAFALTQASIDRALELDDNLADAYATLGLLKMTIWDQTHMGNEVAEAEISFNKALDLNPNHASAYMWYASLKESQQMVDEAIALYEKSIEVDPFGRIPYSNLPALYAGQGQYQKALRNWVKATDLHPEWTTPYRYIAMHLNNMGRIDEALAWNQQVLELTDSPTDTINLDMAIFMEFGEIERAREAMFQIPTDHPLGDIGKGLAMTLDGQFAKSLEMLLDAVERQPDRPGYVFDVVSTVAILAREFDTARKYVLLESPILASDSELVVDKHTIRSVVKLGYIEQQQGHGQVARDLLTKALPYAQSRPRLGMTGDGIVDVQILALLGRKDAAIAMFQEAVEEGFRSTIIYNSWPLALDPFLESLKDDPRYQASIAFIDQDVERMHQNAIQAEEASDWQWLRDIAITEANGALQAMLSAL